MFPLAAQCTTDRYGFLINNLNSKIYMFLVRKWVREGTSVGGRNYTIAFKTLPSTLNPSEPIFSPRVYTVLYSSVPLMFPEVLPKISKIVET